MFKDIKRQISKQVREPLNHVVIPQQIGITYTDSGNRISPVAGVLRFNRKLFVLERLKDYLPTKQNFELFGGDYIFSVMNSNTDGSLNDSFLPQFSNIEYSTSFVPSKDGSVLVPYEFSEGSYASIYVIRGDQLVTGPTYILSKTTGKISIELISGEQVKLFVYYYNSNTTQNSYGYIKIFRGLSDYIGSWAYIDVTPPVTPEWHTVPLVTQAADVNASTTSVTIQLQTPIIWDDRENEGILVDPDLAGHNIYRISSSVITSGASERADNNEVPQTIIYSGSLSSKFVHGATMASNNTVSFLAQYNDSLSDEYGSSVSYTGTPRFRSFAKLGNQDVTNYVINGNMSGVHGYLPSGWLTIGTGIISSRYSDSKRSFFTEIKCTGLCGLSQNISLLGSRKYRLDFGVENITDTVSTVYLYKNAEEINSYQVSGTGRADRSIEFNAPMDGNITVTYTANSGTVDAHYFNIYNIQYERGIECCSQARNYVINGGFENGFSGWNSINIVNTHWGNSLFGYKTPTITMLSGGSLYQSTTLPSFGPATISVYLSIASGTLSIGRAGGVFTTISGPQEWKRYYNYSSTGNEVLLINALSDCTFGIDGVQLESSRRISSFDDVNQDGLTTRPATYINYSGVSFNNDQGTIRFWFSPSWQTGDMNVSGTLRYLFTRGSGTDMWAGYYNQRVSDHTFEFLTISGSNTGKNGIVYDITSREEILHVVYSWSGTDSEIWINGVRGTTASQFTNPVKYNCSSTLLSIGGASGQETKGADGVIDSFLIDSKKWTSKDILADYNAVSGDATNELIVIGTATRKANFIPNSNFSNRSSLSGINEWNISNSANIIITADYAKPKSSDVALKIITV